MKAINLHSLEIQNFRKLSELTVNFNGLQLITGKNGSGKSSIFEALYTCLYGRRPNGQPAKTAIKKGEKTTYLKLTFSVDNDEYVLERYISNSKSHVSLYYNGVKYVESANTVKQIIDELIPNYILKLSMLDDIDIKNIITKLVDIDKFIARIKQIKDPYIPEINRIKEEVIKLQTKIDMNKQKLTNLEQEINRLKQNTSILLKQKDDILKEIDNVNEEELQRLVTVVKMYPQYKQQYIDRYTHDIKQKLQDVEYELQLKTNELNSLKQKYQDIENWFKANIHTLEVEYSNKLERSDFKDTIYKLESNINEFQYMLKTNRSKLNDYLNHLNQDEKICPVCKQVIADDSLEEVHKQVKKIEDNIKSLEEEIQKLTIEKEKIEKAYEEFKQKLTKELEEKKLTLSNEYQQKVDNILSQISTLEEAVNKLNLEKQKLTNELRNIETNIDEQQIFKQFLSDNNINVETYKQYYPYLTGEKDYYNKKQQIQEIEKQIKVNNTLIKEYQDEIVTLSNETKDLEFSLYEKESYLKRIEKTYEILNVLDNSRLWKKITYQYIKDLINQELANNDFNLMSITLDLDDKENVIIKVTNLNGDEVGINDLSQGESIIAKLVIYNAIRKIAQTNVKFNSMFLDEVIDKLDPDNLREVLRYLKSLTEKDNTNILVITHNTYAMDIDIWDDVIALT